MTCRCPGARNWPGRCPGPADCPCCQPDTIGQRDIDDDALVALLAELQRLREGVELAIEAMEPSEYLEAAE